MTTTTPLNHWSIVWTPDKVQAAADARAADGAEAFARYAQQQIGIPYPTQKDLGILKKKIKELFAKYEQMDYYALCRLVTWAKNRKKRFARIWALVEAYRDAWAEGQLPELDPKPVVDEDVELGIQRALGVETNESWRRRLTLAVGPEARGKALLEWTQRETP